ncbi:hypothetical protein ARMA_0726 [Ardenticatena maritima]|uniref:Alpha-glucosidase n=1 Tax=Ardenticatena maritima TaxID=872965 RepID=A0A0M8K5R2_9CHLR|nr:alpha-glucosidase [Ardenticatena maritima]GAP62303.1 hypothetical protein ARMA_0726 [Ardenticatena maritima]
MKRRWGLRFLVLVLVLSAGWYAWNTWRMRPIVGALEIAPEWQTGAAFTLGEFDVLWNGKRGLLSIHHHSRPEKTLWANVPGRAFVGGGVGVEEVRESRGLFRIEDHLRTTCADQTLDDFATEGERLIISGQLRCSDGSRVPYRFTLTPDVTNHLAFRLEVQEPLNRTFLTYANDKDEHFFGFGEQFTFFDLKGHRVPILVSEQGIGRGKQPLTFLADLTAGAGGTPYHTYIAVPHYITSKMRSLMLDNSEYAEFNLRAANMVQIRLFAPVMVGTIINGDTPTDLIQAYTARVGRMRPLPDWILQGAVVGMQGGTARVRDVWQQLQAHETPIAAFWLQDWVGQRTTSFGKQLWWNWELDTDRYPEWEALVNDLHAQGVRVMLYVSPFLADVSEKPNHRRNLFAEALENGYLVTKADGSPYLIQNTSFAAGLVDLTNPDAYAWLQTIISENLLGIGADGWMADFGEALPWDAHLAAGIPASTLHNRYPELWARLNRETIEDAGRGDDVVFFMRAGFTRSPLYATLFWEGDQLVSWDEYDGIKSAVTGLLSSGLSGFAFNHSDIGGYTTITNPLLSYHRSKELLMRWMELNAFTTVYRTHEGNIPDANAQFYSDDETLAHFSRMAKVYAAWAFYRRQLVDEAAQTGLPVVRHLFLHYPDDPNVWRIRYEEFLVGTELLVAPVLDPQKETVDVYLPAGRWVHVWTGEVYGSPETGTHVRVSAPLGYPAVFYREGSDVGAQFVANLRAAHLLDEKGAQP